MALADQKGVAECRMGGDPNAGVTTAPGGDPPRAVRDRHQAASTGRGLRAEASCQHQQAPHGGECRRSPQSQRGVRGPRL